VPLGVYVITGRGFASNLVVSGTVTTSVGIADFWSRKLHDRRRRLLLPDDDDDDDDDIDNHDASSSSIAPPPSVSKTAIPVVVYHPLVYICVCWLVEGKEGRKEGGPPLLLSLPLVNCLEGSANKGIKTS